MKTKLLRELRKNHIITITPDGLYHYYKSNFIGHAYGCDCHKWEEVDCYTYLEGALERYHIDLRDRLREYKNEKFRRQILP